MNDQDDIFWIGGATTWGGEAAPGIRALRLPVEGEATLTAPVPIGANPMFAALAPCGSLVVSHEVSEGALSLFPDPAQLLKEGTQPRQVTAPTDSSDPTNIALARFPDGRRVVLAANYGGGALSVNEVTDGGLGAPLLVVQYQGSGPDAERQESPHPHQVVVDGNLVLVPDLGTDSIHVHDLADLARGDGSHRDIALPPGSGPRHLVVSDGCALVACELSGLIRVVSISNGAPITDASPTVRASDAIRNFPSAIRLTERGHVLVGNRGPDTIGVLRWEPLVESLQYQDEFLCGGQHPRDFQLNQAETRVVVANLVSNNVAVMEFSDVDGNLSLKQTLPTGSPSCTVR